MPNSEIRTTLSDPIKDAQRSGSEEDAAADGPGSDGAGTDLSVVSARAMSETMAELTAQTFAFWSAALGAAVPAAGAGETPGEGATQQVSPKAGSTRRSWYRKPVDTPVEAMMKFWGVDTSALFLGAWSANIWSPYAAPVKSWFAPWGAGSSDFLAARLNPFDWMTSLPGGFSGNIQPARFMSAELLPNPFAPDMNPLSPANGIWDPTGAWSGIASFWPDSGAPWLGAPWPAAPWLGASWLGNGHSPTASSWFAPLSFTPYSMMGAAGPYARIGDAWSWLANPFEIAASSSASARTGNGARRRQNVNGTPDADRNTQAQSIDLLLPGLSAMQSFGASFLAGFSSGGEPADGQPSD